MNITKPFFIAAALLGLALDAGAAPEALFTPDGRPGAAAMQAPHGFTLRTRAGLYATPAQLEWELLTAEPYTVLVDADEGRRSVQQIVAKVLADHRWSRQHWPDFTAGTAHFVRSASAPRAVATADALTAAGLPLVFVVVAPPGP